jgi:hypothetical protein
MRFRVPRRNRLVAVLFVLQLLVLAVSPFASHEGHGCHVEKDCLACRWAADNVAEATVPVAAPRPVEMAEAAWCPPTTLAADAPPEAVSSRGPPRS